jgi:glycosyltransferase involved in cell wall biosynthesis
MHDSLPAMSSISLKLVESIVAGVPCVTADIGDRQAIADGAGIAVTPNSPEAMANGILTILNDESLQWEMRENSRKIREDYYWDRRVHSFLNVYAD